jgi:molecular chaperone DnaJ
MLVCQECHGAGKVFSEACASCQGSGRASGQETITVKIPAGVNDGGRMRVPGKGEAGPDGSRGDLFLRVHVTPHRFFRRELSDLHLDMPVTISEAALGARVEVPTMEGVATLKIPPGTQTGAVLRLKGKGVASPKSGRKGDLMVHLKVVVPERPDEQTRRLLEQLKEIETDPRAGKFI